MTLILLSFGLLIASGGGAFLLGRRPVLSSIIGAGGIVVGCGLQIVPTVVAITHSSVQSYQAAWGLPLGSFHLQLDALSAWFLLPISVLSLLAAVYGTEYMAPWMHRKNVGASWFFLNVLIATMGLVVLARDGILFLFAWELMSLCSFFLVTFENEKKSVRDAGWNYLVATHIGTACLFILFLYLSQVGGGFDFDRWNLNASGAMSSTLLVILAVVGFGTKAGFVPFHIWLPEAHPAAPSHVSAVMSGVMIKTGLYGLIRIMTFSQTSPPLWWGWLFIGIGMSSGLGGILFAMTQRDLKRFLAYSSVENMGIMTLGLGVGLLGSAYHSPSLAILGFSGCLMHVLNHAFNKGLLFLGAGAVLHSSKTLDLEQMGGLYKKMPWTGTAFLMGSLAISGLPPFNGFISEFLIYLGAGKGIVSLQNLVPALPIIVVTGLAVIGGLSVAGFTRAFGMIFLGQARHIRLDHTHEIGWRMRLPMLVLSFGGLLLALAAPLILGAMTPVLEILSPSLVLGNRIVITDATLALHAIVWTSFAFFLILALLTAARLWLLSGREVSESGTWDCGYAQPTSRMEYTASSFIQPLSSLFRLILRSKEKRIPPSGVFPTGSFYSISTPDVVSENIFRPLYHSVHSIFSKLRWFQHGRLQAYILYIGLTLLFLLIWNLR